MPSVLPGYENKYKKWRMEWGKLLKKLQFYQSKWLILNCNFTVKWFILLRLMEGFTEKEDGEGEKFMTSQREMKLKLSLFLPRRILLRNQICCD